MSVIKSKNLYINSKNRISGSTSDFFVTVPGFLDLADNQENYKIKLSVLRAVIPYSFYNLSTNNNKFRLTESDADGISNLVSNDFSIPIGNYDAITFRNKIKELIDAWVRPSPFTYTFLFDRVTHKFSLSIAEDNKKIKLEFLGDDSAYIQFGFTENSSVSATFPSKEIISSNVIQLSGDHQVYVKCSLSNDNMVDMNTNSSSLTLVTLPVDSPPFHLLTYTEMDDKADVFISNKIIDNFRLFLTNQNSQALNLNGLDWEIVLNFMVVKM